MPLPPPPRLLSPSRPRAVLVVDPISTGVVLSHHLHHQFDMPIVCVWSEAIPDDLKHYVDPRYAIEWAATVQHEANGLDATVAAVRALEYEVCDVCCGSEPGVYLSDLIAEALRVRGNGSAQSSLRRNKFLQTEAVRSSGLNACGQMLAVSAADVETFLRERPPSDPFKAVVKPVEGAGSDGVFICNTPEEVRRAFGSLEGTKNVLGLTNYEVLLQEYLRGDEYVVDTVSRSGVHKCVAIWKYDKRLFNGSPVVYYGMRLSARPAHSRLGRGAATRRATRRATCRATRRATRRAPPRAVSGRSRVDPRGGDLEPLSSLSRSPHAQFSLPSPRPPPSLLACPPLPPSSSITPRDRCSPPAPSPARPVQCRSTRSQCSRRWSSTSSVYLTPSASVTAPSTPN